MIKILYEDNHLIVCIKPINVPVQEDSTKDIDMLTLLKKYIKDKYNKPGNVFVGLVHRLDRPVGGIMVFARTSKGASRLSDAIRKRELKKQYLAVVEGLPEKKSGELVDFLIKESKNNTVHVVHENTDGAKEAVLRYKVVDSKYDFASKSAYSLIKIDLITGRPHQIRVQFSSRGYPLVGDVKYGSKSNSIMNDNKKRFNENILLWSYSLEFEHPTKNKTMFFKALPEKKYPWNIFDFTKLEER